MKTLIKNGTIIDGTGNDRYKGHLVIENDLIVEIYRDDSFEMENFKESSFDVIIDAFSKVVCPGFIDTHSHSAVQVLKSCENLKPKIMQGITTEIVGQDGVCITPLPLKYSKEWRDNISAIDGTFEEIETEKIKNLENYFSNIRGNLPINLGYLVPHGNVRMEAMGFSDKEPNFEELEKMKQIIEREFKSGAIGFSTGLIYFPCSFAKKEEIIECLKTVAKFDGVFVVHQRNEADNILESMDEIIEISREANVKLHISHMKVCGMKNREKISKVFEKIKIAKSQGIEVSFDSYPYSAGSTTLGVLLPIWAHEGGVDKLIERLENNDIRELIKKEMLTENPTWESIVLSSGIENVYISSVQNAENMWICGKSIKELGDILKKDPIEAVFDLLISERNNVGMVDFYGHEDDIQKFILEDEQNFCTDGLFGAKPHPRLYGSYPRVLGEFVREKNILSLESAIKKMTFKAAEAFNIKNRGKIEKNYKADVVVFDPDKITNNATFENPNRYPNGIDYILINGTIVVENEVYLKKVVGEII